MKIVPIEDYDFEHPGEDGLDAAIDEITIKYLQPMDTSGVENEDDIQELTISTRNNGCARFINIKTNSWSIESEEEIANIIKDFRKRAELV